GFALTHFLSKAGHLPRFRHQFAKAAVSFVVGYDAARGRSAGSAEDESCFVRHALGCMLARVAGRSTLEYLSGVERGRQRRTVVALMHSPPRQVAGLVRDFLSQMD